MRPMSHDKKLTDKLTEGQKKFLYETINLKSYQFVRCLWIYSIRTDRYRFDLPVIRPNKNIIKQFFIKRI
jgi:hypothetical protein